MKAENYIKFEFPSRSVNEGFARAAAAAFAAQLDPTMDELGDIKTAVSEAVTNCIVHAYQNSLGKIRMTIRIFENRRITIQIRDNGCGIPDIKQAMEPMFTTCTTGERSGLGFAVMQSFMDRVSVRSAPGRGTTVTLQKTLSSREESHESSRG